METLRELYKYFRYLVCGSKLVERDRISGIQLLSDRQPALSYGRGRGVQPHLDLSAVTFNLDTITRDTLLFEVRRATGHTICLNVMLRPAH
jgi:hypothetical protein